MKLSLRVLRDALSVVQIGLAVTAVGLGGGASIWALVGIVLLTIVAFVRPLPEQQPPATARLWTALVLVALVGSLVRAIARLEFLDAGIDFLLLLVVQRMFNRQHCREHLQLLLLGSILMVIGAVINADLNYPLLLTAFVPIATMALIVNELLAQGERLGARVRHDLGREGQGRQRTLWRASLGVAAIAGACGLFVFFVFPRFGVGVFLRGSLPTNVTSGFSDEVKLGGFGRIKTDTTVIMRMKPTVPMPTQERLIWHLRGSAFDHYQDGTWTRSQADGTRPDDRNLHRVQRFRVFTESGVPVAGPTLEDGEPPGRRRTIGPRYINGFAASSDSARMSVTLEDIGTELLFAASEPIGVRLQARSPIEAANYSNLRDRGMRQLAILNKQPGPVQYEFLSRIGEPTRTELQAIGDPQVELRERNYVQRPETLSPEFRKLARDVTQDATTRIEKVEAVMGYLGEFGYTLDLTESARVQAGADPVEGFVFDTKEGHCEYFATAMALLLREAGVPTRNVNGYYGAHYNDVGDFYAVRQADAHSWVEVDFGPLGWVTFDPTPPAGRMAGDDAPLWPAASQVVDAMRNAYLEYVIDYDLGKQLDLLQGMGIRREEGRRRLNTTALAGWLALPMAAAALVVLFLRRRRRGIVSPEAEIYVRLLSKLATRGHERRPGESARSFARRLAQLGAPEADPMGRFAQAYERQRFGPTRSPADIERLRELARETLANR
jgi:transglutaminase-like putative cysteine protease